MFQWESAFHDMVVVLISIAFSGFCSSSPNQGFCLRRTVSRKPLAKLKKQFDEYSGRNPGHGCSFCKFWIRAELRFGNTHLKIFPLWLYNVHTYYFKTVSGSGIPCKISFSEGKEREVYLTPMAKGISGKLVLVEKIPHQTRRVVIAVAPLVGLNVSATITFCTRLSLSIIMENLAVWSFMEGIVINEVPCFRNLELQWHLQSFYYYYYYFIELKENAHFLL